MKDKMLKVKDVALVLVFFMGVLMCTAQDENGYSFWVTYIGLGIVLTYTFGVIINSLKK